MIRFAAATAAALLLATGASAAQMAAPAAKPAAATKAAPKTASAAKATPKAQAPRTAASLECSKQADAKALHGKPRKSFMSSCKSAAKKG